MQFLNSKITKFSLLLASVALLSACVNPVKSQHNALIGVWQIVDIDGRQIGNVAATMQFSEQGIMTGNNGCNAINASYQPFKDHLNLSPIASTRKACTASHSADEQAFNDAILHVEHFLVKDNLLLLTDEQDQTVISLRK
ncbi:hypothetical protein A9R01_07450 ['Osedax' symbiont bacterium Rs2_46_30_T18]|nr:hypothetical protein A9R01_07450 ['Osedax' symbiont bacterium Rs2_46_30_T18]